jgi:ABC-2 type transport system ATP-binding protein
MKTNRSELAIEICNLNKVFRKQGKKVDALKQINLKVRKGEVFGFLGPNGAGKTTLIKIMMGMLMPDSGDVFVMGQSPSNRVSRNRLGYLPERPYLHDFLTSQEFLKFHGRLFNLTDEQIKKRTPEVLEIVGLGHALRLELKKFSKGMLQRIGLAQALLHDPDVLILDEPMSGLDPLGRREVRDLIAGIAQTGKTVFFSTHIVSDIEAICSNVGFIDKGVLKSIDDIDSALGKTVKSVEIQFRMQDSASVPRGAKSQGEIYTLEIMANKQGGLESLEAEINLHLKDLIKNGAKIRSVVHRKADLEELFFNKEANL